MEQAYPLPEVYLFVEVAGLKTAHHEEVETSVVMPVIVKNDDASPKRNNFAHGDLCGESNAQ
jgi:hypothetical protein